MSNLNMSKLNRTMFSKGVSSLILSSALATAAIVPQTAMAAEEKASDNYIYAGLEVGFSDPVWKKFEHKDALKRTTKISLKKSNMLGGRLGWNFYPNMAIEISGTNQPKHEIGYELPSFNIPISLTANFPVPSISGKSKVKANVYTINLLYSLPSLEFATITPYVIGGAGIASVNINSSAAALDISPAIQAALNIPAKVDFFRIKKHTSHCPTYQFGIGFKKDFGDYIAVDLSSKFQIIQNIKIKYQTIDVQRSAATGTVTFQDKKPIKKTVAMGEFALGILFKLPM